MRSPLIIASPRWIKPRTVGVYFMRDRSDKRRVWLHHLFQSFWNAVLADNNNMLFALGFSNSLQCSQGAGISRSGNQQVRAPWDDGVKSQP